MQTSTLPQQVLDDAELAHCQRVAAYCAEIASHLRLPLRDRTVLHSAAINHHTAAGGPDYLACLANELGLVVADGETDSARNAILAHYSGRRKSDDAAIEQLAGILEMADLFDEQLEAGPYSAMCLREQLASSADDSNGNPAISFVLPHLRLFSRSKLLTLTNKLPVFPSVALEVIKDRREGEQSLDRLIELASSDQSLAGSVLQSANTAAFTVVESLRDIRRAVILLGTQRTSDILIAAAMKPLIAVPGFPGLWEHSLEAAQIAERIAQATGVCSAADGYVLGLLHDVGKLLLRLVPQPVTVVQNRLIKKGCSIAVAELLTVGASHADAGADVLRHWRLPNEYVAAVEYHHEPEHCDTPLAALLYVVEHRTASEEDLPSASRLNVSLRRLGLTNARSLDDIF